MPIGAVFLGGCETFNTSCHMLASAPSTATSTKWKKKHPKLCECETRHATNYEELLVFTLPETITASSHLKLGLFSPQIWKLIIFQPLRKSGAKMLVSSSSFHKGRKSPFQEFWN